MTTHEESLLKQYADIPFLDVNDRIMLVLLNRSVAQMHSDRRYVVQVAVNVLQGSTKKVRVHCVVNRTVRGNTDIDLYPF